MQVMYTGMDPNVLEIAQRYNLHIHGTFLQDIQQGRYEAVQQRSYTALHTLKPIMHVNEI